MHLGPGPIVVAELIAAGRRWQNFALRVALIVLLLIVFSLTCLSKHSELLFRDTRLSLKEYAELGTAFVTALLGIQLQLILLAGPAISAGAICKDRSTGNLAVMLTTPLSSAAIVIQKFLGRLWPVLWLIIASAPVMFLASLMGGVEPDQLIGGYVVLVGTALLSCALGLCLSGFVHQAQDALILSYLLIQTYMIGLQLVSMHFINSSQTNPRWIMILNPQSLLRIESDFMPESHASDYWIYLAGTAASCILLIGLCAWRLRRSFRRLSNRSTNARGWLHRWWIRRTTWGALLDRNPALWYEIRRSGRSLPVRLAWAAIYFGGLISVVVHVIMIDPSQMSFGITASAAYFVVHMGLLLTMVGAVNRLADDRGRECIEAVLSTPLSTKRILRATWRASFRAIYGVMALILILALAASWTKEYGFISGMSISDDGAVSSLAIFFVLLLHPLTCAAMMTSVGVYCAVRFERFGRAFAVAFGFSVLILGVVPFIISMAGRSMNMYQLAAAFSPDYSVTFAIYALQFGFPIFGSWAFVIGAVAVSIVYFKAAGVIFRRALRIFRRQRADPD